MDFDIITSSLKKGWEAFTGNAVAFIVGFLIALIGSILIVTIAPLFYGFYYMAVKASRGEKLAIKDVFYGFKSFGLFIRAWIYFIVVFLLAIIIGIITSILTMVLTYIHVSLALVGMLISILLSIVFSLTIFYTMYIYIMTPSKNIIYALKEGFGVFKGNVLMTIVAYIVYYILTLIGMILLGIGLLITIPIAMVFTVSVLKALRPTIQDGSD
ncbi:MAG: hypothetical protein LBE57_03620 [Methanosarcinales archaeon]|jgi:uncharacterized membrane protein|nr:hypothetical protein [Methanosarcinales archaeon]